jgi:hypothetical protein
VTREVDQEARRQKVVSHGRRGAKHAADLALIGERRVANELAETGAERTETRVARFEAYLRDGILTGGEQSFGVLDA